MNSPQETDWAVYLPPGTDAPTPLDLWPYERIDIPDGRKQLLVVVASAAALHAVREIREMYTDLPLVVWAWRLSESLALDAEDWFPVVYGWPTHDDVGEAYKRGPGRTEHTRALADCETAFRFPDNFVLPASLASLAKPA